MLPFVSAGCAITPSSGHVEIPNTWTSIGDEAFYQCSSLTSVSFESGSQLSTIGSGAFPVDGAFAYSGLTSITLPASLTSIGTWAFLGCSSLTTINFESGSQLTTIGRGIFQSSGLTSITLPASLTSIGDSAFYDCSSLTSVSFESGSQLTSNHRLKIQCRF